MSAYYRWKQQQQQKCKQKQTIVEKMLVNMGEVIDLYIM